MEDLSHVHRLKEEHIKRLQQWEEKRALWENFKADYEGVKERLTTLPNALSYDVTVPFGPNAFTLGKIVHTNEVMVLLGDNWFAEVSAKQAVAIADRRIEQCCKMLDDLEKEKVQSENWLDYIDKVSSDELVEIMEEYDEEKEKEWREQHSRNVKAYHTKLAKERINHSSENENNKNDLDDDFLKKLEELELMENLTENESVCNSVNTNVTSEQSEMTDLVSSSLTSEEIKFSESEENRKSEEEFLNLKKISSMQYKHTPKSVYNNTREKKDPGLRLNISSITTENYLLETESGDDDGSKSDDISSNLENYNAESTEKHVRWQDLSKQKFKKITFKHSKSKFHTHPKHHLKRQESSESDEPQLIIQSPSDIYKHFGSMFQATSPKSILKVKNSPTSPEENEFFSSLDEIDPKDSSPEAKSGIVDAFSGKVYENSSPVHITEMKSSRPVSHFKNSRKNKKRIH